MTHTTAANDRYAQLLALSRMGANRDEAARSVGLSLKGLEGLLWRRLGSGVWPVREVNYVTSPVTNEGAGR